MTSEDSHWYCLRTRPKLEKLTSQLLRAEVGIEVFCPFIRFEKARQTGRTWVTEALFPCYVFARFQYAAQNRHIRSVRGVVKLVGFGSGLPSIVPDAIIADLRSQVQDQETITVEPTVKVGEEVNVVSGPFRGIRAVVSRVMPAKERVALLLEVLGMEREIEIASAMILPDLPHPISRTE